MSFSYVGQPYTAVKHDGSPDWELMEYRYLVACKEIVSMLNRGMHVYSPIVHCHELAKMHSLPHDFAFWKNYNRAMLAQSERLIILPLEGWETSVGLTDERKYSEWLSLQISFWDLEDNI